MSTLDQFLDPTSGWLTPEEDAEYERYIEEGDVISLLQAKTRRLLEHPGE